MTFTCKCNRTFKSKRALGVHKTYCEIFLGHVSPLLAIRSRDSKSYRSKPEVKEKYSKIMTELNSDPEFKDKVKKAARENILRRLNDPDEKAKIIATLASNSQSEKGRRRAAHLMLDNHNKFEFMFSQMMSYLKNVSLEDSSYVYLIRFSDKIKVGFTTSVDNRICKTLHPLEILNLIKFNDVKSGYLFEFNFHQNYKNCSIGGEYYPIELAEKFNKIFIDYNRQKILPF